MLHAQAEIVFAHLNAPWLGTFFSPEAFLAMMRLFGAYRVGHAADGGPLLAAGQAARGRPGAARAAPANALEGIER